MSLQIMRTGRSRTSSHLAGSNVTGNIVEQTARLGLDLHVVVDVLPGEDVGGALERVGRLVLFLLVDGAVDFGASSRVALLDVSVASGSFDRLDEFSRSMTAAEQHDTASRSLVLLVLVRDEVDGEEEEEERPDLCGKVELALAQRDRPRTGRVTHETKVAPRVGPLVTEVGEHVRRAVDDDLARRRSGGRADLIRRADAGVARSGRNEVHAGHVELAELVGEEGFETEGYGLGVTEPAEPDTHRRT